MRGDVENTEKFTEDSVGHEELPRLALIQLSPNRKSVFLFAVSAVTLPYRIAVLVFIEDNSGRQLLMLRAKPPNQGIWSPIGGKLETGLGESPHECARRETFEETGHEVTTADLHLFGLIAEKAYEGQSHWLLFLFRCRAPLTALPPDIAEGKFGFFTREEINHLPIPETDRNALWPLYDRHRDGFVALKADCGSGRRIEVSVEQVLPAVTP